MLKNIMATTSKKARKAVVVLTLLIPVAALISVINVAIAMSTSNWLDSAERIPIGNNSIMEEFMIKRTVSGLWYLCSFNLTEKQQRDSVSVSFNLMNCSSIEYFVKDRYTSDPNDSTNAIRFAVTKAGPLFVVASILLGFAVIAAIFGYQRHRRIALFISGIAFIVSGLMLLIGLVVYLSALQSEIGPKLRPRNSVDLPQFSYRYGYSFLLVVIGFMATECTGILAIFYYIYWHQLDWTLKLGSSTDLAMGIALGNGSTPGHRRGGGHNHSDQKLESSSTFRCHSRHHQSSSNSKQGYKIMDIYDHNYKPSTKGGSLQSYPDFDIPFPPPPPCSGIPRDYTTLTSCSDEDQGSVLFPPPPASGGGGRGKDHSRTNTTTTV